MRGWKVWCTAEEKNAADWWEAENRGWDFDCPEITTAENGIPDAMRCEDFPIAKIERGGYTMPDERVLPWLSLVLLVRSRHHLLVSKRWFCSWPMVRNVENAPVLCVNNTYAVISSEVRHVLRLRWATCFGLVCYFLGRDEWSKGGYELGERGNQLLFDCTKGHRRGYFPFEEHQYRPAGKRRWAFVPSGLVGEWWNGPASINTLKIPRYDPAHDPFNRLVVLWTKTEKKITKIGHKHTVPVCYCDLDWRIWQHWRPWSDPFGGLDGFKQEFLAETMLQEFLAKPVRPRILPLYLKNILWEHKQTEPQAPVNRYKDWRTVPYFARIRTDYAPELRVDAGWGQPWRVRYWEWFADMAEKSVQIEESPGERLSEWTGFLDNLTITTTTKGKAPRIIVDLDHTIIRRKAPTKKVLYKDTHDSAAAVMAHLGCSRATAFRRIKEGFHIPVLK